MDQEYWTPSRSESLPPSSSSRDSGSVRLTVSVMVILAAESLVVDLSRRKLSINSLLTNKR